MRSVLGINDVFTGNVVGIVLMVTLLIGNYKKFRADTRENRLLSLMMCVAFGYCLLETLSGFIEGRPGGAAHVIVWIMQTLVYASNVIFGFCWARFIALHLNYPIKGAYRFVLNAIMIVSLLGLIGNIFTHGVFYVDESNCYAEGKYQFIYILIAIVYTICSLFVFIVCKKNGGELKFFPVWVYITPSIAGIIIEGLTGCGTIGVCNGIALAVVIGALQDEIAYRDRLTGVYSRGYLEEMRALLERKKNPYVSGIMLDMNGFKLINDDFGHAEGDTALVITAGLIRDAVGSYGDVIRYAGDEFIVILNTTDKKVTEGCVERINAAISAFNAAGSKPYKLSLSMGCSAFNAENQTINEFLNLIDRTMYDCKKRFYEEHPEISRRKEG